MTVHHLDEAIEARELAAPKCEATVDFFGIEMPCRQPAIGRYRRICVHEHVREGRLCRDHAKGRAGLCKACFNLDGGLSHECPINLAEVTA